MQSEPGPDDLRPAAIAVEHLDDVRAVVVVRGDLDLARARALAATLDDTVGAGVRYLRLDVRQVPFMDCTALGVIVGYHHRFRARQSTLVLAGPRARVARLLHLTGLDRTLFVETADD